GGRRKGVGFAELVSVQNRVVGGGEGGAYGGAAGGKDGGIGVSVDAIVLEIFVHAHVELRAVAGVGAVGNPTMSHRGGSRKSEGGRSFAGSGKDLCGGLRDRRGGAVRSRIAAQDLGPECARKIRLGPIRELRILISCGAVAGRGGSAERLDRKEEKELMMRND